MVKVLQTRERRYLSPHPAFARAQLEPIHQPLYSVYDFPAAQVPSSALFCQYAVGGQLAGNTTLTATVLDTNMPAAGSLPMPKLFLVEGLRIVPIQLDNGPTDPLDNTVGTTFAAQTFIGNDSTLLEDLMRLVYGSYFELFVGTKNYLQAPSFLVPANTGIDGTFSQVLAAGGTLTNAQTQRHMAAQNVGRYFELRKYPVLIPSQQNFAVSLNFPQGTARPTLGARRRVYAILDGILGRETQ